MFTLSDRRKERTRSRLDKAVLFRDGVPYLAPELCLLYKSTDPEREGYQQDFDLACPAMNPPQREWLRQALLREFPGGHPWLETAIRCGLREPCQTGRKPFRDDDPGELRRFPLSAKKHTDAVL